LKDVNMRPRGWQAFVVAGAVAVLLTAAGQVRAASPDSERLGRAKDDIADEQWARAIRELRAALNDPRETGKDEALYWLAHSLNESGDQAAALETIRRLEREYPASLWIKPAGALRLEMAVRLKRKDVLWWTAVPPEVLPPEAPARPPRPGSPATELPAAPAPPAVAPAMPAPPAPPVPPMPQAWLPDSYSPDTGLRIQALGSLIRTDGPRVIPILRDIALASGDPVDARRAIFVLAQSGEPQARATVAEVAKAGPDQVRIAAVRELGRFGGPETAKDLLQVYASADATVKRQVVTALGQREDRTALVRIARSEKDPHLRDGAIVALGQAGGGAQLEALYPDAPPDVRRAIVVGLFNARAEDALIRMARGETDPELREQILLRLRLLGTPAARAYLQERSRIR
jgi:hypothetical protein